jgi:sortase A
VKCTIKRGVSNSKRPHPLLRWSRDVFLIIGILLLGYCGYVLLDTKIYQAYQTRRFEQQMKEMRPGNANDGNLHKMAFHPAVAGALGEIEIPRIGVSAMIMEGIDNRTLRRAVGHIPGTPLPGQDGNVGIAGHRDTFFRALRNVRTDDEITLTTVDDTYHYRVEFARVVEPSDTQVLDDSSGDTLTLVTCYPFYFVGPAPKRFIVRSQRIP